MCGRFAASTAIKEAAEQFAAEHGRSTDAWSTNWTARYNIKPTNRIPVLIDSAKTDELRFETAHWSVIPPWEKTKKPKYPTFNAKAETLTTKPTWRGPIKRSRCIVLADGWYEWTGPKTAKQPWYLHRGDQQTIGFAGLYSWWKDPDGSDDPWLLTATIVTAAAPQELAGIHDRAPVLLPQSEWPTWLSPEVDGNEALVDEAVATSAALAETIDFYKVPRFGLHEDEPAMVEPLDDEH